MRRTALIAAVLGLGLAGTAEAHRLSFSQGRLAIKRTTWRSDSIGRCWQTPTRVRCYVTLRTDELGATGDALTTIRTAWCKARRVVVEDSLVTPGWRFGRC